jgi:hypothetical protein
MADLGGQKAAECKMLGRLGAERNPLSSYVTRTPWLLGEKKRNLGLVLAPRPPRSTEPSVTSVRCFSHWAWFSHPSRRVHGTLCNLCAMLFPLGLVLAPRPPRPRNPL